MTTPHTSWPALVTLALAAHLALTPAAQAAPAETAPASAPSASAAAPASVRTVGRMQRTDQGWLATWPGVAWVLRFEGDAQAAVGVRLNDAHNRYTLQIDGRDHGVAEPTAGEHTVWLRGFAAGPHELRVIKRTESEAPGEVRGFLIEHGHWLPAPAAPARQIEFIGDSWTAALGNLKNERECDYRTTEINSDASQGFGLRVAQHYQADWQLNAISGLGMVRNWNGSNAPLNLRSFYGHTLRNDKADTPVDAQWHPQVIVIGLGINDFSTPVAAGEAWTSASLGEDYSAQYRLFVKRLREQHPQAHIVATATYLWPDDRMRPLVQAVVKSAQAAGDKAVSYLGYEDLALTACLWHPNLADHQKMAGQLIKHLDTVKAFSAP